MQTKLVDGESATAIAILVSRFFEINRYVSVTNHSWACSWLVANGETWKSMPSDLQDMIERNALRYIRLERADTKAANVDYVARLAKLGLSINQTDQTPFRRRLGTYYDTWTASLGPTVMGLLQGAIGRRLS